MNKQEADDLVQRITTRLPRSLVKEAKRLALESDTNLQDLINSALVEFVSNRKSGCQESSQHSSPSLCR